MAFAAAAEQLGCAKLGVHECVFKLAHRRLRYKQTVGRGQQLLRIVLSGDEQFQQPLVFVLAGFVGAAFAFDRLQLLRHFALSRRHRR